MVLAFAGDSTMTSFLLSVTLHLPFVAHHTHGAAGAADRVGREPEAPDHGGGPAVARAVSGTAATLPATATDTTSPSAVQETRRAPSAAATRAAVGQGSPATAPEAASAAARAAASAAATTR